MSGSKKTTKFFTNLLLVLFVYSSFGYLLCFLPAQALIKHYNQKILEGESFEDGELITLIFSIKALEQDFYDFRWIKADKEFRFNDKMYDVKNKKIVNDSIYYQCYYDEEENMLEELLSFHFDQSKKDKNQSSGSRILLLGLYLEKDLIGYREFDDKLIFRLPISKNEVRIFSKINDVPTPPPRAFV